MLQTAPMHVSFERIFKKLLTHKIYTILSTNL